MSPLHPTKQYLEGGFMIKTSEPAVIALTSLDRLFCGKSTGETIDFRDMRCVGCGQSINVKVQKTSGGYGFLGGIILEQDGGKLLAKCCGCNDFSAPKEIEGGDSPISSR